MARNKGVLGASPQALHITCILIITSHLCLHTEYLDLNGRFASLRKCQYRSRPDGCPTYRVVSRINIYVEARGKWYGSSRESLNFLCECLGYIRSFMFILWVFISYARQHFSDVNMM